MSRTVLFVEVPCFYAEVERSGDPSLLGRPLVVGGDPRKNGTVQSASPEALEAGVETGMRMVDALARCPGARALRTDMKRYREASARLRACFRSALGRLELAGLGAAYFDASRSAEPPEGIAKDLARRVRDALDLPMRVGIAPAKFLARLAAEEAGGEGLRRIEAGEEGRFLAPLPVERLPGVGPSTAARLAELGATTVGELSRIERDTVERELGSHGGTIWALSRGEDPAPVLPSSHRKSLSQESSFDAEQRDLQAILSRVEELVAGLEQSLELEGLVARRVTLKLRFADQEVVTRSRTREVATASATELQALAAELLERTQAGSRPVRAVGITLAALAPADRDDRQLPLFPA